jgi:hypothetical protein
MQFTEAFAALGYRLQVHRTDWTAVNESGVCISLWQKQVQRHPDGRPWHDTGLHGREHEIWKDKPGNRKRIEHIKAAMEKRDGFVDVVIVNGEPGESYGDAHPWIPEKRKGYRWRVTQFDEATGHFRAEAQKPSAPGAQK